MSTNNSSVFLWTEPDIFALVDDNDARNVNKHDSIGMTPLLLATKRGYVQQVRRLIWMKANMDVQDNDGATALSWACSLEGRAEIVCCLLEARCNPNINDSTGMIPLTWASQRGYVELVQLLIKSNSDLNFQAGPKKDTSIMIAAREGYVKIVKHLALARANLGIQSSNGETVLHKAADWGHVEIAKCIIRANSDLDIRDKLGRTPIVIAIQEGHIQMVKTLITADVNLTISDNQNLSPLDYISQNESIRNELSTNDKIAILHGTISTFWSASKKKLSELIISFVYTKQSYLPDYTQWYPNKGSSRRRQRSVG